MARRKKEPRGQGITVRTPSTHDAFLTLIANGKTITSACEELEIARSSIHKWIREDEDFAALYEEAIEAARDRIREEIDRRAIRGVPRIKFMGGRFVREREYSDVLLKMTAVARLPEYRNSAGGASVTVNNNTLVTQMTEEELHEEMRRRGLPIMMLEE